VLAFVAKGGGGIEGSRHHAAFTRPKRETCLAAAGKIAAIHRRWALPDRKSGHSAS